MLDRIRSFLSADSADTIVDEATLHLAAAALLTLPAVYSEHQERPGLGQSNLGMYRVQLSGGQYRANQQVGLQLKAGTQNIKKFSF